MLGPDRRRADADGTVLLSGSVTIDTHGQSWLKATRRFDVAVNVYAATSGSPSTIAIVSALTVATRFTRSRMCRGLPCSARHRNQPHSFL